MRVTPLQPMLGAAEVRAREDADPSLEGAMMRAAKGSASASSPAAVELISSSDDAPSKGGPRPGSLIDTYA